MNRKDYLFSQATFPAAKRADLASALALAEDAACAGGKIIRERFGAPSTVHWKRGVEEQISVDLEAEKAITALIVQHFPHDTISGEELGTRAGTTPYTWVIDPLDGTSNFVLDIPQVAVCISLKEDQKVLFTVIYQPMTDRLYIAKSEEGAFVNGTRIHTQQQVPALPKSTICSILTYEIHGEDWTYSVIDRLRRSTRRLLDTWAPSLDWCLLATGKIDALIYLSHQPLWIDPGMLAGASFFLEAGGMMSDLLGNTMADITQFKSVIAATSPALIQEVCQLIVSPPVCTEFSQSPVRKPLSGALPAFTENSPFLRSFDVPR